MLCTGSLLRLFAQFVFAVSTDEGLHWRVLLDIRSGTKGPKHYISTGACPTLSDCFAIGSFGSSPYATYTTDGGLNWELAKGERRVLSDHLSDAQCFSLTTCYAVDGLHPDGDHRRRTSLVDRYGVSGTRKRLPVGSNVLTARV